MSGGADSPRDDDSSSQHEDDFVPPSQPALRKSARLSYALTGWSSLPSENISAALTAAGIQTEDGLSRAEIVSLANSALGNPEAAGIPAVDPVTNPAVTAGPASQANPTPRQSGKRKAKAKHTTQPRGRGRPAAAALAAQRAAQPAVAESPIFEALQSLNKTVQGFDSRLKSLEVRGEHTPASTSTAATDASTPLLSPLPLPLPPLLHPPPSRAAPPVATPVPTPAFSLASAQPAPLQGRSFIAQAAASISPAVRANILNGKDTNLASLLLPASPIDRQLVNCGDVSVILKTSDPRLLKNLSFGEFVVAFGVFRDVLCGAYPERRAELDSYLAMLADFHLRYGGTLFYEYHKSFAAKAASYGLLLQGPTPEECLPPPAPPFAPFRVNSLGVATRKYSGKKRLIFDMSSPHSDSRASVNEMIPLEPFSLHYATVDHAIKLIKVAGRGAHLAKADITDAFKTMPIHPSDWPLFCVKWQSAFYFAVRLTFGCRSSPRIFNNLSEALCWILLNVCKLPFVLHLLDDFLLIDFPSKPNSTVLDTLRSVFHEVGVPLSPEKTLGPCTSLEFLGIVLDSVAMKASLPQEKLSLICDICAGLTADTVMTKRDLLSLLGHLNFAIRIIPHGRSFISRVLDVAHSVPELTDSVALDQGCHSDLRFWLKLLGNWNGISFFYNDSTESSSSLGLFTDAAPSVGFGGFHKGEWFADSWPDDFLEFTDGSESSALFEMYPIVVACVLWGSSWCRKRIVFYCDNEAVVAIINKGRSKCPKLMALVRRLTWQSVMGNFVFSAAHVPGHSNVIADALSRFHLQEFRRLCPSASSTPLRCPSFSELVLY
ncbi:uncharacterized protein LOC134448797 [Engraulis encrasicolus]|uniref:uncharacterized protein LOC134448797 n=1 Tax=Engraulis encrasicolus TaxID=184585 RepID=UPI002FD777C3